ncbi:hypothetical protein VTI74DRAFT_8449 [Chaetomium olivicolor]
MPSQSWSKSPQSQSSVTGHAASGADLGVTQTPTMGASGDSTPSSAQDSKQVHKTKSWYGSWPRVPKSAASTQVARETILGGTSKPKGTADFSRFEPKKLTDTMSVSAGSPTPSVMPKIQEDEARQGSQGANPITPAAELTVTPEDKNISYKRNPDEVGAKMANDGQEGRRTESPPEEPAHPQTDQQTPAESAPQRPASGWFGWWARAEPTPPAPPSGVEAAAQESTEPASAETSAPDVNNAEPDKGMQPPQETSKVTDTPQQAPAEDKAAAPSVTSWLWSWSSRTAPVPSQPEPALPTAEAETSPQSTKEAEDAVVQDAPAVEVAPESPTPQPKAGSTWAFWSRDTGSSANKRPAQQGEQGQLAVMGERSERHPQRANSMEFKGQPPREPPLKSGQKDEQPKVAATKPPGTPSRESSTKSKRVHPQSMEGDDATPVRPSTPKVDGPPKPTTKAPTATKTLAPNLLLPCFNSTYRLKDNPSIIKQIAQLLLRTQQPSAKHVYLTRETPRIKKAIAIGVHGLFPANYLRPMIGQPTGTSIKFANHCAEAIRRWADSHGCEDCEIEKVALEGEGKIAERVENLWKLLLNWIDHIRNADLILIACHSQGVPVSIMLLAKLIELGVVTTAKVGVCAMAGVSLGPFPDYRSSMGILMGSAAELWEFADPKSGVSQRLEASVKAILAHGARITYVGSIDDQLVPLESAIYAPAHHPYIFRAVFIDGRIHAPDFIAHLVGFALKLRNLGVSDHGLIRELSTPLAGSLYSGEGHSRLYDDQQVYDLAVTHALETTDVAGNVPCDVKHRPASGSLSNPNPYHLPWIMRGLLEEDFVKTELSSETAELVRQFDDWKPVTKALKDVKYRLEAVRSKL